MKEFQQTVWRAVYLTQEDHHLLFRHHSRIFDAIKEKNAAGARDAMIEHLAFAEQRSTAYVTRQMQ
jgi:GntR family transcriptional repressor for pyruvate dehydrogenase complex